MLPKTLRPLLMTSVLASNKWRTILILLVLTGEQLQEPSFAFKNSFAGVIVVKRLGKIEEDPNLFFLSPVLFDIAKVSGRAALSIKSLLNNEPTKPGINLGALLLYKMGLLRSMPGQTPGNQGPYGNEMPLLSLDLGKHKDQQSLPLTLVFGKANLAARKVFLQPQNLNVSSSLTNLQLQKPTAECTLTLSSGIAAPARLSKALTMSNNDKSLKLWTLSKVQTFSSNQTCCNLPYKGTFIVYTPQTIKSITSQYFDIGFGRLLVHTQDHKLLFTTPTAEILLVPHSTTIIDCKLNLLKVLVISSSKTSEILVGLRQNNKTQVITLKGKQELLVIQDKAPTKKYIKTIRRIILQEPFLKTKRANIREEGYSALMELRRHLLSL